MGLFFKTASVNLDDITQFQKSVDLFIEKVSTIRDDMMDTLTNIEDCVNDRVEEYAELADSYNSLYHSVKNLQENVEHYISDLKSTLAQTPKQLENKHYDSQGNLVITKNPNPVYKLLEAQIQEQTSKLASVKELSYTVYDSMIYSRNTAHKLTASAHELTNTIPDIEKNSNEMIAKAEDASFALERNIKAVDNYLMFDFNL